MPGGTENYAQGSVVALKEIDYLGKNTRDVIVGVSVCVGGE